jgi:hypothetical protein
MLQPYPVAPAKAGVQENKKEKALDTGLRRHDGTSFLVDHVISTALSHLVPGPWRCNEFGFLGDINIMNQ